MFGFLVAPFSVITEGNITTMVGYIGGLVTDFMPLIGLVIGLPLGFWVINKVVSMVRAR